MEEVIQVGFVELAALDQHLQVEIRTMKRCYPRRCHRCSHQHVDVTMTT